MSPRSDHNQIIGYIEPKSFPPQMLDQRRSWVFPDGTLRLIKSLDEDYALFALSYSMANASRVRKHYAIETKLLYDEDQNPRRWILDKVAVRALMRRLIALEDEKWAEEQREDRKMKWLTPGAEAKIEDALDRWIFGG